MKLEYQTIIYKKTPIRIRKDFVNKPKVCEGCGKTISKEIKKLDCHHWIYEFDSKFVKRNPIFVLKNTNWLCFRCHMIGDAIRICHAGGILSSKLENLRRKSLDTLFLNKLKELNKCG